MTWPKDIIGVLEFLARSSGIQIQRAADIHISTVAKEHQITEPMLLG